MPRCGGAPGEAGGLIEKSQLNRFRMTVAHSAAAAARTFCMRLQAAISMPPPQPPRLMRAAYEATLELESHLTQSRRGVSAISRCGLAATKAQICRRRADADALPPSPKAMEWKRQLPAGKGHGRRDEGCQRALEVERVALAVLASITAWQKRD